MINIEILLIVLGGLCVVLLGVLVKKLSKVKVWVESRQKDNQPFVCTCYLEKGEDGEAAEVHRSGAFGKPAVAIVKVDEKSTLNRGYVDVLMTDMNDDAEKPHYRRTGFVSFDQDTTVDQYGYIYKQIKGKKEKEVIGYLARPSKPNEPTIYGERSWKTLWLKCVLHAYAGLPAKEEGDPQPSQQPAQKPAQPVEHLCINSPRKKAVAPEVVPEETPEPVEEVVPEEVVPELTEVPILDEPVEEPEPEPVVEEPVPVEEPAPVEETPVAEPEPVEETPEPEPEETPAPEPTPEPAPVKPLEKPAPKKPLAICSYWGFHNSKKDLLPAEARAGAYALLQRFAPRQKVAEYASEQPYGWKDTALLSAFIYTVLFLLVYLVNSGIFQMPLLGKDWQSAAIFVGYYFVLWAIVRYIKIDAIENANSFQPILDLFNKNLGMKWMNISIIVLCMIASAFTLFYLDYDFLPLLIVIATGITINMTLPAANRRWKVQTSFLDDSASDSEDEDEEPTEPQNPQGDISRSYEWKLDEKYDATRPVSGSLTLYFKAADVRDVRHLNPFFDQRKDKSDKENILYMFHFLKRYRKTFLARTNYVAYTINKIAEKNDFSPIDKLQFTLDFVQEPNIAFLQASEDKIINNYDEYIRYPDETLYDKCGDSNSKALLAAMLFHLMGHNVLYLISRKHKHAAVAVEVKLAQLKDGWYGDASKVKEMTIKYEDRYYIFCETTGDNLALGSQVQGMSLEEFDEKIYLPLREDEDDCDNRDDDNSENVIESRIYEWKLDSLYGNQLQGKLALEISSGEIEELRRLNPFNTYGQDRNTYLQNVQSMFQYLKDNPDKMAGVRQVTDYIRQSVKNAGFPELDMLQFALDFAQKPNIKYVVDEQSLPIEFAKEYMRFPAEVLYDKEGDCDCKSSLAAALFLSLGYKVLFMISEKLKHAAIGVECKDTEWLSHLVAPNIDDVTRDHNGTLYLYCETTGDGYHVGQINENESMKDFEQIIELTL